MASSQSKIIIKEMLEEIQMHKRKKEDLLNLYVSKRINKQIHAYYENLMNSYSTLTHQKNELKVAKNLIKNN